MGKQYSHLKYEDRQKIEYMYNVQKLSKQAIADNMGCNYITIYREIPRGIVDQIDSQLRPYQIYSAEVAQLDYNEKASNKGPMLKIGNDHKLAEFLETKIADNGYSPAAALGEIKNEGKQFNTSISVTTLYRYIYEGLFMRLTSRDLPEGRRDKKQYNHVQRTSYKNPLKSNIDERPAEVEGRDTFGHWEMDTVVGTRNGKSTSLLVLTERKTRLELIVKLQQRTQKEVTKAVNKLQRTYAHDFKRIFKTITVDNGSEFLDYKAIEKNGRTKVYYCHPFSSWERGSNENANKLIRRFIPKGTDIGKYTKKEIERIQHWINNYPRKIFNYGTSQQMFNRELLDIVA